MHSIDLIPKVCSDRNIYESVAISDFVQSIGFNGYFYHASCIFPELFFQPLIVTNEEGNTVDYLSSYSSISKEVLLKKAKNQRELPWYALKQGEFGAHPQDNTTDDCRVLNYIPLRLISGVVAYFLLWRKQKSSNKVSEAKASRILSIFHGMHAQIIISSVEKQGNRQVPLLTRTERCVLKWTAEGKTASETAQILGVTERTINFHVANIISKLEASNKTHAIFKAVCFGIIP